MRTYFRRHWYKSWLTGLALLLALSFYAYSRSQPKSETFQPGDVHKRSETPLATATGSSAKPPFIELGADAGLKFAHFNGMSGEYYMCEMVGPGAALFDYDNDGDLDVYIRQGQMLGPDKTVADATFPPKGPLRDQLFRNDLDGDGNLSFTDVTQAAHIDMQDYGIGVAAGDIDNDGFVDLYLTNFGPNRMLRNLRDGTFADVTQSAGVGEERWSSSAAFLDFDRDGWLDLFVCNYVQFDYKLHKTCASRNGQRDYCGPNAYTPEPNRLFRNRGNGTFEDVPVSFGIASLPGPSLGVTCADFNGDGWQDIYVTNDGAANHLWLNQSGTSFIEDALLAGCALNGNGVPEASMGIDAADFDGDGDEDLFMTHLNGESNTLFANDGAGLFSDMGTHHGLEASSHRYTAFGVGFFDYDNDGWLDLMIANGEVRTIEALARENDSFPLHQPNQLYRNTGGGKFLEATAGKAFDRSEVSRGLAFGDMDNDGDTDVLVLNNNAPARLLINQIGTSQHFLGLRLRLEDEGRDAQGAKVAVVRSGKPTIWRRVRTDGSYCSANDPRLLIGLGTDSRIDRVDVYWPDGTTEEFPDIDVDTYCTLQQSQAVHEESPK